ncbi:S-type pyocin domain-containing protein [Pseudomonas huaxiensis]|uniref:S-type pyocin domain-containing protein n=1 Tax=Pseudomonas huaxiensis TaxID=2213017 RepID=UPI001CDBCBA1|nr:S-type pyocin domain-containing protein [Pseudomonas huaxiensis]
MAFEPVEKNIIVNRGIPWTPPSFGPAIDNTRGYQAGDLQRILNELDQLGGEPAFYRQKVSRSLVELSKKLKAIIEFNFTSKNSEVTTQIEIELRSLRENTSPSEFLTPYEKITNERNRVDSLIRSKARQLKEMQQRANSFFGSDPLNKTDSELNRAFMQRLTRDIKDDGYDDWATSYDSAYVAKYLTSEISYLTERSQSLFKVQSDVGRVDHTFKLAGAGATQLSTVAGSIAISAGSNITLEAMIQAAIQGVKAVLGTVLGSASAVGIGLLAYSASLGNGERPSTMLNLPAKSLAPDLPDNLHDIAIAHGTVSMPYRIYGDNLKYSVIATQALGGLPSQVPVRVLSFDSVANAYVYVASDAWPTTLTFPIAVTGNSSTSSPAQPVPTPVYTGITLTPIEVKAVPLPAVDQLSIQDAIYVYPADSGLPPIYVVFSEPLDSGKYTRKQLDKKYKHAEDFGVADSQKNQQTLTKFRDAIEAHLADIDTIEGGTYIRSIGSRVFYNLKTNNVVIISREGQFLSAWQLDPTSPQFKNYIEKGVLQ